MDLLTFTERLVSHLAWPISIVVVALIFHKELRNILSRARNFKIPGIELSLHNEIQELSKAADEGGITRIYPRETYDGPFQRDIANNPLWAFLEIWIEVEGQLKKIYEESNRTYRSPNSAILTLRNEHRLSRSEADILIRLSRIRNKILHVDAALSDTDMEYLIGSARTMRDLLAQKTRRDAPATP